MALIVSKAVKKLFKTRGVKTSGEAIEVLNKEFENLCQKAADEVLANNLKTVKGVHVPKMNVHLSGNNVD